MNVPRHKKPPQDKEIEVIQSSTNQSGPASDITLPLMENESYSDLYGEGKPYPEPYLAGPCDSRPLRLTYMYIH
jgi:hypothetical protein